MRTLLSLSGVICSWKTASEPASAGGGAGGVGSSQPGSLGPTVHTTAPAAARARRASVVLRFMEVVSARCPGRAGGHYTRRLLWPPPPLWGRVGVGGKRLTPHPGPPPQGGREKDRRRGCHHMRRARRTIRPSHAKNNGRPRQTPLSQSSLTGSASSSRG